LEIQSELQIKKIDPEEPEELPSLSSPMPEAISGQGFQPSPEPSSTRHQPVACHHDPSPAARTPATNSTAKVTINNPGSKRHASHSDRLRTEQFQGQELLFADVSFPERRPVKFNSLGSWGKQANE